MQIYTKFTKKHYLCAMKCKLCLIISIAATLLSVKTEAQTMPAPEQEDGFFSTATPAPKREVRAVWITTLSGLDWPKTKATSEKSREEQKAELCQILDRLQECHINTIFLQTRVRGSVIYPSQMEPWDVCLTGRFDKSPGYDPLQFAIEEAHRRSMELHAWVVTIPCFKIANAGKMGRKCMTKTHPELLRKLGDTYYADPGLPGTATYLTRLCHEIVEKYDVDGLHFDYIRYPENAPAFPDGQTFRKYGKGKKKDEWRRDNVTAIVSTIYKDVKELKPWVRISCSPVGKYDDLSRYSARGWAAYSTVHQDAQRWLRDGVMDMLCPMMYFQGDHFYPFAADWQERAYGRTVAPGLGIYFLHPKERDWEWGVVQRELCYLRQQQLGGQAYFRSQFLTDNTKGIYDYLKQDFYPHPALMPAMTWQSDRHPAMPVLTTRQRLQGINEHLEWQPVEMDGTPCRYAIYASKKKPVDTERGENLITVTQNCHYTYNLLSSTLYGLHLAITAIDRYGNESEPLQIP